MSLRFNPDAPQVPDDLGKKAVKHFMTQKVYFATASTTVERAIKILLQQKVSGLPVVDDSGSCIGMISELDLIIQGSSRAMNAKVAFRKPVHYVHPDTTFKDTLFLLVEKRIKRVPVLDRRKKLLGIVSRTDLLKALYASYGPIGEK